MFYAHFYCLLSELQDWKWAVGQTGSIVLALQLQGDCGEVLLMLYAHCLWVCGVQDWRPGVQQTAGGKPRRAAKDEPEEEVGRVPFDPRAEVPAMPSDGSFQGMLKTLPYSTYAQDFCHLQGQ